MADKNSPPVSTNAEGERDPRIDLVAQRFAYCSLAGALCGCVLSKSPVVRWPSIAFGAGFGFGSAFIELSGSSAKFGKPKTSYPPASPKGGD